MTAPRWYVLALSAAVALSVPAAGTLSFPVTADSLRTGDRLVFLTDWKYNTGDDPAWGEPEFDDGAWQSVDPSFEGGRNVPPGWDGIGWFRCALRLDPRLRDVPLSFLLYAHAGAFEVYLDGELVHTVGRVKTPEQTESIVHLHKVPVIVPIVFRGEREHIIAVRASLKEKTPFDFQLRVPDFRFALSDVPTAADVAERVARSGKAAHIIVTIVALTFAFLHLLLFVFYPKLVGHLYYAIFTGLSAALAYLPLRFYSVTDLGELASWMRLFSLVLVLVPISGIRFLHAIFYDRLPRVFWIWPVAGAAVFAYHWNGPVAQLLYFNLVSFLEVFRVLVLAVARRKRYAWLIAAGIAAFILASAVQIIVELTGNQYTSTYLYGLIGMLVLMSVYLALSHAAVNRDLQQQLSHVQKLSAEKLEHERRAKEQEMEKMRLEADNALKEVELAEARKRQQVLDELAKTNHELRETQTQLVQSEKMAALGNLVAGVAHEINTPVGAICSMHNTLVRAFERLKASLREISPDCDRNEKLQDAFKLIAEANAVIESGSDRVTNIVRRLRSFARLDEAELKTVDIHEGIEDTLTLVHHELKHNIKVHRAFGKIPAIACYPGQLNQVFLNLLMNARQAIAGEGEITIKTYKKDAKVFIEFRDTGKGIPKEQLGRIFDPGFTTKGVGVGTGLGLSICYQIMQAHKGEIRVESAVNKGSTFTVVVPMDLGDNDRASANEQQQEGMEHDR